MVAWACVSPLLHIRPSLLSLSLIPRQCLALQLLLLKWQLVWKYEIAQQLKLWPKTTGDTVIGQEKIWTIFFFNIQIYLPTKYFLHYKGKFSYVTGITFLCQGIAKQYWFCYRHKFGAKDLCSEILCYCWAFVFFVESALISCQIMNE